MLVKPIFGTAVVAAGPVAAPFAVPPTGAINPVRQISRLRVQALAANAAAVTVGTRSGQTWVLTASAFPLDIEVSDNDYLNLFDFYVNGTAGDTVTFMALPCNR